MICFSCTKTKLTFTTCFLPRKYQEGIFYCRNFGCSHLIYMAIFPERICGGAAGEGRAGVIFKDYPDTVYFQSLGTNLYSVHLGCSYALVFCGAHAQDHKPQSRKGGVWIGNPRVSALLFQMMWFFWHLQTMTSSVYWHRPQPSVKQLGCESALLKPRPWSSTSRTWNVPFRP